MSWSATFCPLVLRTVPCRRICPAFFTEWQISLFESGRAPTRVTTSTSTRVHVFGHHRGRPSGNFEKRCRHSTRIMGNESSTPTNQQAEDNVICKVFFCDKRQKTGETPRVLVESRPNATPRRGVYPGHNSKTAHASSSSSSSNSEGREPRTTGATGDHFVRPPRYQAISRSSSVGRARIVASARPVCSSSAGIANAPSDADAKKKKNSARSESVHLLPDVTMAGSSLKFRGEHGYDEDGFPTYCGSAARKEHEMLYRRLAKVQEKEINKVELQRTAASKEEAMRIQRIQQDRTRENRLWSAPMRLAERG
jgi:hypothetical protein